MPAGLDSSPALPEGALPRRRLEAPSWLVSTLLSMAFHLGLILLLGVTLTLAPAHGTTADRTAEVGIVLKHQDGQREYFEGPDEIPQSGDAAPASVAAIGSLAESLAGPSPIDPSDVLPSTDAVLGLGALEGGGVGTARGAAQPGGSGGLAVGGKARTALFGVEGEGHKFVYVFDRSGSMGGPGRSALSAAKAELLRSLESLDKTHQFQIIFYNHTTLKFNPTGDPDRLVFATEQNKAAAERFLGMVTADGGTNHELALSAAFRLRPDVIFFLTDADEPKLYPHQLARLHRLAGGATIHAVEFGFGPQQDPSNFLVRLARENGGKHVYVDVARLLRQ
jgi:hypothetical protein